MDMKLLSSSAEGACDTACTSKESMPKESVNRFLLRNMEKADLNQYWYSKKTIEKIVDDVCHYGGNKIAFLSTPSIYFSLPEDVRKKSTLFDLDSKWVKEPRYVLYDFNKIETIPKDLYHTFTMVVIDPPFITAEVWEKYTEAAKLLLLKEEDVKDDSKELCRRCLCTTIHENAEMMYDLLKVKPNKFRPSIPNLVYQYDIYTSYESEFLNVYNPEVDWDLL